MQDASEGLATATEQIGTLYKKEQKDNYRLLLFSKDRLKSVMTIPRILDKTKQFVDNGGDDKL